MNSTIDDSTCWRNNFIDSSFHATADLDYIASRICLRNNLINQGLWSGLQAIEKYCKATLVYCGMSVAKFKHHNIEILTNELNKSPYFKLILNKETTSFIKYLNTYGPNRYFQFPISTEGNEIIKLDMTVWNIRRYCQNWSLLKSFLSKGDFVIYSENLNDEKYIKRPMKFRCLFSNGLLEKILAKKEYKNLYPFLVWKNIYFGINKKNKIIFQPKRHYAEPDHFKYPGIWDSIKDFVYFSSQEKKYFQEYLDFLNGKSVVKSP